MKNILVVKRLNIFTILIVIVYKLFKFEVHVFEFSKQISSRGLVKFLSLHKCNFEECIDVDTSHHAGKAGNSIDEIVNELTNAELMDIFIPFFVNVQDPRKKITLLIKKYVIYRCSQLERILLWVNGYFINHNKDNINIYLLGDVCRIGEKFLLKQSSSFKVTSIFSSNFFLVTAAFLKVFGIAYSFIFNFSNKVLGGNNDNVDADQLSFISNYANTLSYKVIYFPHKSIFYGRLHVNSIFYSKDIDSVFYPSNILHIEFENITISRKQSLYYKNNNITSVLFPRLRKKVLYNFLIYTIGSIGLKKCLIYLWKNPIMFVIYLFSCIKFLSTKDLIKKNYNPKIVLIGYDIHFPIVLSLAFESLKIRSIAVQERFLQTFFSYYMFCIDTYLCNSKFVCKILEKSNDKLVNNCIPCGQTRTDILINYQKNTTNKNKRFTIIAFDFHSNNDFNINRLHQSVNWRANASFYEDLCKLAERFTEVDIIIRGKDIAWTKIPYFKEVLAKVNRISNIWIDDDYSKMNKQYKLAAISDLVIAKHTSIGDELLAVGKKVIYHDYIPNSSSYSASSNFNYNGYNIFAHSYDHLERMVKTVLNGGELLTDEELLDLQVIVNNFPADGKVKQRVMNNLDILVEDCQM